MAKKEKQFRSLCSKSKPGQILLGEPSSIQGSKKDDDSGDVAEPGRDIRRLSSRSLGSGDNPWVSGNSDCRSMGSGDNPWVSENSECRSMGSGGSPWLSPGYPMVSEGRCSSSSPRSRDGMSNKAPCRADSCAGSVVSVTSMKTPEPKRDFA